MDRQRIERYQRQLYSRVPVVGGWLRRRAAETLARDGSPAAVRVLAEAVVHSDDVQVRSIALAALRQLTHRRAISAACSVWVTTRHTDLTALLTEREWVASTPPEVKVLTALKVERLDVVTQGGEEVVEPLVQACADRDPDIGARARQALPHLENEDAQEAFCRLLVERDHPVAREAAIVAGYLPRDEQQRALFLFLTEQWERYDDLDFDRQLLRAAYAVAEGQLRDRVREKLRAAGRTDFLPIIAGADYRDRATEMTASERDVLLQTLAANHEWEILWRLAFDVPFFQSAYIVKTLARNGWRPEGGDDRDVFEKLTLLAGKDLPMPTTEEELKRLFPPALLQARAWVPGRINDVAFSPARPVIAIGTGGRKVVVWNYQRAERERVMGDFEHSVGHVTFASDNTLLCAERTNALHVPCTIYGWDGGGNDAAPFRLGHHSGSVTAIVPVGESQVLSTGRDHEAILWDVGQRRQVSRRDLPSWARSARVSPDGRRVAFLSGGLDLVTLPQLDRLVGIGTSRSVIRCAAFLPDGDTLLAGRFNGDLIVYEYKQKYWLSKRQEPLTSHEGRVEGVEILPDRSVIVSAGSEGLIKFIHLQDRCPIGEVRVPLGQVTSLHISPDRSFMAVGNSEASLSLWDLRMLDVQRLLMQPFARAAAPILGTLNVLVDNESLPSLARLVLNFADCVLRHRFRFDIELDEAPTIMSGEFDIEIE
jgi:hypothetical protein